MVNSKELFSLDKESIEILQEKKNKSKFVRDAIKKLHVEDLNKKPKIETVENILPAATVANPNARIEVRWK